MSKAEKLIEKIRNNPKAVSFEDLDKLLRQCGFIRRQPGGGSSHMYYTRGSITLSVPYRRPHLKEVYVKQALSYIEQALQDDE